MKAISSRGLFSLLTAEALRRRENAEKGARYAGCFVPLPFLSASRRLRGELLPRPKLQRVLGFHILELHGIASTVVIVVPLVLVVSRKRLAGLSYLNVQQRAIPIAQVRVHAHRRRQNTRGLLGGGGLPKHRRRADFENIEELSGRRNPLHGRTHHRVIDFNSKVCPILPPADITPLHPLGFLHY